MTEEKYVHSEEPTIEEINEVIESLCLSKAEEFHMLGYTQVTGEDIWKCVSEKYVEQEDFRLHRVVNDILSLKTDKFMNWMLMRAYKLEDI